MSRQGSLANACSLHHKATASHTSLRPQGRRPQCAELHRQDPIFPTSAVVGGKRGKRGGVQEGAASRSVFSKESRSMLEYFEQIPSFFAQP